MFHRVCYVFAATAVLGVFASSPKTDDKTVLWHAEKGMIDAIYTRGRQQILMADISPLCRQNALTALAESAAANDDAGCSTGELADRVGKVFAELWDSVGNLLTDVNTVINGIPVCMSQYSIINVFGKFGCLVKFVQPIWAAVKDFWHYDNFWMNPYNAVKDAISCYQNKHAKVTNDVKLVVQNAKLCK